ncbi:MAG: dual specificity protein phosphatase family protein [Planctomycetes bacterium]|nr:dual specificity protein phosphatase family protein [Planctomycetota bacterium]
MNGFSWVVEGEIAGMARPHGRDQGLWPWLAQQGIKLIVSLTTSAPDANVLASLGMDLLHVPIEDFSAPSAPEIEAFLQTARFYRHEHKPIVVHCGAGMGRTGTLIACYLVDGGMSAQDAIALVRKRRPGSIETQDQEQAVQELARTKGKGHGP